MMPVTDKAIPVQVQLDGQKDIQDLTEVKIQTRGGANHSVRDLNPTNDSNKPEPAPTNPNTEEPKGMEDTPGDAKRKGEELGIRQRRGVGGHAQSTSRSWIIWPNWKS